MINTEGPTRDRLMRRLAHLSTSVTLAPSAQYRGWETLTIDGECATVLIHNGAVFLKTTDGKSREYPMPKHRNGWSLVRGLRMEIADREELARRRQEALAQAEAHRTAAREKAAAKEHAQKTLQAELDAIVEAANIGTQVRFHAGEYGTASVTLDIRVTPASAVKLIEALIASGNVLRYTWRKPAAK